MRVLLASTYELGRQPFGLASAAAWLRLPGVSITCCDLAVQELDEAVVADADVIAFYVPMHTATRLAVGFAQRVKAINPTAHLCFFGLYAPMNEQFLRDLGADSVLGGEFEEGLRRLVARIAEPASHQATGQTEPVVSVARQRFLVPDRSMLPPLRHYAHLTTAEGGQRVVGYTEATRGCKHVCRHCPVVPIYEGRFRVVQRDVVLDDVANQVAAGAEHITFGDPDFFNGPAHAMAVVTALHHDFPQVSYDVTIKVEHLLQHADLLPRLRQTGCALVTTAVESFDERILEIFDKRHSIDDVIQVVHALRDLGIGFNPTFVAFTPWTSRQGYVEFLTTLRQLGLVANVSPVQYAIRLLIPSGSKLLDLAEVRELVGDDFDPQRLAYRWRHPDPSVDQLFVDVDQAVRAALAQEMAREEVWEAVMELATAGLAARPDLVGAAMLVGAAVGPEQWPVPYLSEPWYC